MLQDLRRKVTEKFGDRPFYILYEFPFPDHIEGGDGICYCIQFENGKVTAWLRTSGLYYESDAPEISSYLSKLTEWPAGAKETIDLLNLSKHGVDATNVAIPIEPGAVEAAVAQTAAIKHVAYLSNPTPPDPSGDVLRDEERNADLS